MGSSLHGLRILFVAGTLGNGGAERQLYYWVRLLRAEHVNIKVLCLHGHDYYQKKLEDMGIDVVYLGRSKLVRIRYARKLIKRFKPNIVQSIHFHVNFYVYLSTFFLNVKTFGAIRSDGEYELRRHRFLGRFLANHPKILISNSLKTMKYLKDKKITTHVCFLPNGIDTGYFNVTNGRTNNPKKIIAVGNIRKVKRYDVLLSALDLLNKKGLKFRASIIGEIIEPETASDIAALIGKYDLSSSVSIINGSGDLLNHYSEAAIFVLSSDHEGTPNVLLEAMACGLPVIATAVGDVPEIVHNGKNGFVLNKMDGAGISEKLELLMKDEDLRKRIGISARNTVVQKYSLDVLRENLKQLYCAN